MNMTVLGGVEFNEQQAEYVNELNEKLEISQREHKAKEVILARYIDHMKRDHKEHVDFLESELQALENQPPQKVSSNEDQLLQRQD